MSKNELIKILGRWNYFKWWYMNKVLKKKTCYNLSLTCDCGVWSREYIDDEGNFKVMKLN